ncbi:AraC family transcriptional regulator [Chitinophaga sp. Mgbs1]|uniref:AraC family transcriptional regulator n=1 Tax=Chitinophaga solisilvae TaxID=1233460 RepID=A0A9Q5D535_9BACT|nr:AraC family transcriptional regulator [Chitinophaga solisilvae]
MKIEKYLPSEKLQPFIESLMIIESEAGMHNSILPDTAAVMAFRLKGGISYGDATVQEHFPDSILSGLRKAPHAVHYEKNTAMLLVKFREGGATAFLRTPLHEISNTSISLDHLLKNTDEITLRLMEAGSNRQRIRIISTFLEKALLQQEQDAMITYAVQQIRSAKGTASIPALLQELYISRDAFEKRFRRYVGTTPKHFSNIIRFKNIIDTHTVNQSLTATAYAAGYFDQAHFIRDFRIFTGKAPREFFRDGAYW